MDFGIPARNEEVADFPLKMAEPLRADRGLNYREFIALVKDLWEQAHPDIPIKPVQSNTYAKYPVIVYGLNLRKTHSVEPKKRYRDTAYREGHTTNLRVEAQRFDNVVTFTVITENNPEYCEAIIETFEDFMQEHIKVFKELGASEVIYSRRLPDRERTRPDDDVEERSVAYLVVLEKIYVTEIEKIEQIIVRARVLLRSQWEGCEFWVFNDEPTNELYVPSNPFKKFDLVRILPPSEYQDVYANGDTETSIQQSIPRELRQNFVYQTISVTTESVVLAKLDGSDVVIHENGMGRLVGVQDLSGFVQTEYIDDFQAATPLY